MPKAIPRGAGSAAHNERKTEGHPIRREERQRQWLDMTLGLPINPPDAAGPRNGNLAAYVANRLIGLRVREATLQSGLATTGGVVGKHPERRIEAARRNACRFFRLRRDTQTISLSCVQQNRIIEVQDDAVQRLLHGMGYRLSEGTNSTPVRRDGVTPARRQPKLCSSVGLWLEVNSSAGAAPPVPGKEGRLPTEAGAALHHVQHEGRADFISVLAFGRVEPRFGRIDEILDARTDIKGDQRRRMAG